MRNYGGDFEIARNVRLTDDDFEIVTYDRHGFLAYLNFLRGVIMNTLRDIDGVAITRARCAVLSPVSDAPVHVQADGRGYWVSLPVLFRGAGRYYAVAAEALR